MTGGFKCLGMAALARQAGEERQRELERQREAEAERADRAAEEPPVADRETGESGLADRPPACELVLAPATASLRPVYPRGGRMNFGDAVIAVRYVVDERGETLDDEIAVIPERSTADRERYLDLFAELAVETVQGWSFGRAAMREFETGRHEGVPRASPTGTGLDTRGAHCPKFAFP